MADDKEVIQKVWLNRKAKQKLVTIPKNCDIKPGDYVSISKVEVNKDG